MERPVRHVTATNKADNTRLSPGIGGGGRRGEGAMKSGRRSGSLRINSDGHDILHKCLTRFTKFLVLLELVTH